jgi:hypothetical protein
MTVPSIATPEWVLRVSWVMPRVSDTSFPAWLAAPRASALDTPTWEPVRWPGAPVAGWPTLPGSSQPPLGVDVAVVIPSLAPVVIPGPTLPELAPIVVPMPVGTVEIAIGPTAPTPEAFTPTPDPGSPLAGLAGAAPPAHAHGTVAATPDTRTPSASQLPQHSAEPAARERNGSSQEQQHRRFSFPPPLGAASSSSPAGGAAPSALGFGLATVTGFFAFAAPGLGRRIRLARVPSPRSRSHSPLDRPG